MTQNCRTKVRDACYIKNRLFRECLAELMGTFILVALGDGTVAQSVLSVGARGEFLSINFGWAWAVSLAIFVSGGVSGAHVNPAISLLMACIGRITWKKMAVYIVSQYIGAFIGAAAVYATYIDAINNFDGGVRQVTGPNATAGIFATYPQPWVSTGEAFWDQIFGTFLLAVTVMAVTDSRNNEVQHGMVAIALGSTVLVIGLAYGFNCGFAINPARDFGPRLFTFAVGYGKEVFTAYNYHFWIPLLAPHVGALFGGYKYLLLIGIHLEVDEERGGHLKGNWEFGRQSRLLEFDQEGLLESDDERSEHPHDEESGGHPDEKSASSLDASGNKVSPA